MSLDLKHEWILKQTSFVLFYPFDMSRLLLSTHTARRIRNPSFGSEIERKKKLWRSFRAWGSWSEESIHHIYQDIQKGPVLTLIFNGILTWTCRLIYDSSSQARVNNTNIFILFIINSLYVCTEIHDTFFRCDNILYTYIRSTYFS